LHPCPAAIRVLLVTGLLLLVPLLAMLFTDEVNWGIGDFLAAGALLAGAGMAYVVLARRSRSPAHRALIAALVLLALATVWAELAVGIFH
jgi:uncharacterized membrane protein SirB2